MTLEQGRVILKQFYTEQTEREIWDLIIHGGDPYKVKRYRNYLGNLHSDDEEMDAETELEAMKEDFRFVVDHILRPGKNG